MICERCGEEITNAGKSSRKYCDKCRGVMARERCHNYYMHHRPVRVYRCKVCGEVIPDARRPSRIYCDKCRAKGTLKTCPVCGNVFLGERKYCSPECKAKRVIIKTCQECGAQFENKGPGMICPECRAKHKAEHLKAKRPQLFCKQCGESIINAPKRPVYCSRCMRERAIELNRTRWLARKSLNQSFEERGLDYHKIIKSYHERGLAPWQIAQIIRRFYSIDVGEDTIIKAGRWRETTNIKD